MFPSRRTAPHIGLLIAATALAGSGFGGDYGDNAHPRGSKQRPKSRGNHGRGKADDGYNYHRRGRRTWRGPGNQMTAGKHCGVPKRLRKRLSRLDKKWAEAEKNYSRQPF